MARATVLSPIPKHFRGRLILAFVLFAAVFGALFAFAVETSIKDTEDYLLEGYLRGITAQALNQPEPKMPEGFAIQSYLLTDDPVWLPEKIPGFHEDAARDRHIYITYWPHTGGKQKLAVELDAMAMSDLENQEWPVRLVMLGVTGILVLLALLAGIGIAYFMASPLRKLAHSVSKINITRSEQAHDAFTLYGQQRKDEIGVLSRSFRVLVERMQWALQQESSFSHHVSHEFRTPLALINNALTLLKTTDYSEDPTVQTNLQRIETAQQRLQERVQLFLSLGDKSRQTLSAKPVDLVLIWQNAYQLVQANTPEPIKVASEIEPRIFVYTEAIYIQTLFENTLRNAVQHGDREIYIVLNEDHYSISNRLCNENDSSTSEQNYGYGLEIVRRVCQQASWTLSIHSTDEYFQVSVVFHV